LQLLPLCNSVQDTRPGSADTCGRIVDRLTAITALAETPLASGEAERVADIPGSKIATTIGERDTRTDRVSKD